jgi:hypothetical protein
MLCFQNLCVIARDLTTARFKDEASQFLAPEFFYAGVMTLVGRLSAAAISVFVYGPAFLKYSRLKAWRTNSW